MVRAFIVILLLTFLILNMQMATKPLTNEAIAMTEKKMDMALGMSRLSSITVEVSLRLAWS